MSSQGGDYRAAATEITVGKKQASPTNRPVYKSGTALGTAARATAPRATAEPVLTARSAGHGTPTTAAVPLPSHPDTDSAHGLCLLLRQLTHPSHSQPGEETCPRPPGRAGPPEPWRFLTITLPPPRGHTAASVTQHVLSPGPGGGLPRPWGQEGGSWVTPHSPHARNILTRGLGNQAGLGSNLGAALLRLWASLYLSLSGEGGATCTWDGVGVAEALQVKLGEDWPSSFLFRGDPAPTSHLSPTNQS